MKKIFLMAISSLLMYSCGYEIVEFVEDNIDKLTDEALIKEFKDRGLKA